MWSFRLLDNCVCTFLSKDPSLVHAGGEKDRSLGGTHEEIRDGQIYYKQIGRCPEGPAPTNIKHCLKLKNR